jgi:CRP/FNR family cyclic AMP-dependent transcriptional regulator
VELPAATAGSFGTQLAPEAVAALEKYGHVRTYPAATVLLRQGEPAGHVILVRIGWAKATSVSRGGAEALLALRGPGDILGEVAAVDGGVRSATVTTLVETEALTIEGGQFLRAVEELPGLAMALLRHLARGLRESDGKRLEYVSAGTSGRVATLLVDLTERYGERTEDGWRIELPLSQQDLAAAAATSREAVTRVLRTLREREVVRTGRRRLEVLRPEVLRSLGRSASLDA